MRIYSPEFLEFLKVIASDPCVIIDTETTGLERGEICQIAMCDLLGLPLFTSLVKPVNGIPLDAQRIHGISNEMVKNAEPWTIVRQRVIELMIGKTIIIYNAVYDRKMMHQSDDACGLPHFDYKAIAPFHCAMLAYAEYRGEWNEYHGNYRWQRLSLAAEQCAVVVQNAHDAIGDCLMTAGVIQVMRHRARISPRNPNYRDPQDLGLST